MKTEVSVLRVAAHQHETGAGFGTAAWVFVSGSLGSEKHGHSTNTQLLGSSSVLVLNLVCSLILDLIYCISVLPLSASGYLARVKQDKTDGLRVLFKDHCL